MNYIDTHCHLDGEEFNDDRDAIVQRAQEAGCTAIFLPAIDLPSCHTVLATCRLYPDYCYPMLGLHPEEVRADWRDQLSAISQLLTTTVRQQTANQQLTATQDQAPAVPQPIAIGEVGLDFYWSREFEQEQLLAFEEQVRWSIDLRLPLMIHCRKAQNEMVTILKKYKDQLPGGVFHCFTGNAQEARQLLEFNRFVLGIGGVLTFKKSNLPTTLSPTVVSGSAVPTMVSDNTPPTVVSDITAPTVVSGSAADGVPLERLVLETDAPYMAPVPMRGQRNESAYIRHVIARLAEAYHVTEDDICRQTTANVRRIFGT